MEWNVFKPAKSNNNTWNLLKTIGQTILFWLVFLFLIPKGILELESLYGIYSFLALQEVGWTLFLCFSLLGLYSGYTMSWFGKGTPLPLDCPQELVIKGPYKFVRNPMAVAGIGQALSIGIVSGSFLIMIYALSGAILWHVIVRPLEETDLLTRFGSIYSSYKKQTRCWIPKIK